MTVWFTADLHLQHYNIIKYTNRPFKNVSEMSDTLAYNWDSVVKTDDSIYILGDISFSDKVSAEWLSKRPGRKFICWGNHDPKSEQQRNYICRIGGIVKSGDILETRINNISVIVCHYPLLRWNKGHHGSWMCHGHTHAGCKYPENGWRIQDVGVDVEWDGHSKYFPVSDIELTKRFEKCISLTHHESD